MASRPAARSRGGAGVDLNFIPANAIDHIEVLTDGAAAQYGSDAIAGVINIILKQGHEGGNLQASYGAYQDGGGETNDVTGNIGFQPYDGAHLNFTAEYRDHGYSVRSNALDYVVNPTAPAGTYPSAGLRPIDSNVLNAPGWPILNRIHGDARYQLKIATFDSGFELGDDLELYSFGTYGEKDASSIQNYRLPHIAAYTNPSTNQTTYQYPYGFSPVIETDEKDYGLTRWACVVCWQPGTGISPAPTAATPTTSTRGTRAIRCSTARPDSRRPISTTAPSRASSGPTISTWFATSRSGLAGPLTRRRRRLSTAVTNT